MNFFSFQQKKPDNTKKSTKKISVKKLTIPQILVHNIIQDVGNEAEKSKKFKKN